MSENIKHGVNLKCPKCGKMTYIVSAFGSICSNEECFYNPRDSTPLQEPII